MILGIIYANLSNMIVGRQGQDMTVNNRHTSKEPLERVFSKTARLMMEYGQVWIFVLAALALHIGIFLIFV